MENKDCKSKSFLDLASGPDDQGVVYNTASIRAIKKDFVKEQKKQFEKDLKPPAGSPDSKLPVHKSASGQKSIDFFALKSSKSFQDDWNNSCDNLLPDTGKTVSPFHRLTANRKSLSVQMEVKLSAFEKSGVNGGSSSEIPVKPDIRPKPGHLNVKNSPKSPANTGSPSDSVPEFLVLSPFLPLRGSKSPQSRDGGALPKASREIESPPVIAQTRSKDVPVLRFLHSPVAGKQPLNFEIKGNNSQGIRADCDSGVSPIFGKKNLDVLSPVSSGQGFVKSVTPPPKPPRLLADANPAPLPKPRKEFQVIKDRLELSTDGNSVVKMPETKAYLPVADRFKTSPSNGHCVQEVKLETSKSASKFSADRAKIDQWWESKFIRATQPKTPRAKENLNNIRRINNPAYMYAKVGRPDDIIVGQPLVRHHSDEVLDSTPVFKKRGNLCKTQYDDGPVYHSPNNIPVPKPRRIGTVLFDKDGYAIPSLMRNPDTKNGIADFPQSQVDNIPQTMHSQSSNNERSYVRSKVSNAYSVLRLSMFPGSHVISEEGEYDIDLEEHRRLLRHVSNVKYKTNNSVAKYEKVRLAFTNRLFQYAMIIGLCDDGNGNNVPRILFCFPKEMMNGEMLTSSFCFPDAGSLRPSINYKGETFSFVLTSATGDRRYGLCKRYLPPGSGARLPEALCIVSMVGDSAFYGSLLDAVKESRFALMDYAEEMLQFAYAKPFPQPNHEVYLRTMGPNNKRKPLILKRTPDLRLHKVDFSLLLDHLNVGTLIKVFSAVLLERKIIFVAKSLSTLSSCICAVVSLLYPFEWQHTFVTTLPSDLTDVVEAPTPYILGLLSSTVDNFFDIINVLDEVLVVDLDSGCLLRSEGDENCIIPKKLQKALTVALTDDQEGQSVCLGQKGQGMLQDATVAEAFLRLFVETCGHYTEYVCSQQDGEIVFQRELFVKAVHSRSIRFFLDWFTQTQMFSVFVTGRLKGEIESGYFEERILEYRQEMEETTSTIENMKAIGKKIADFFQKSGDKLRKTFQKAVYV